MPAVAINWWTYVAAVTISAVIAALWYSSVLTGGRRAGPLGKKSPKKRDPAAIYLTIIFGAALQAFILVHFVRYAGALTAVRGAEAGFWLWLGFIAVAMAGSAAFERRPRKIWGIDAGYYLVILLINGALLAAWR